ncbi:cell surface protein SprA [Fulvitalea axinellae]|uniref:Cell surface protein SprA n=2 Tax=Fulvitalea axinellae TaxID=1182444 RepID=A0AAU9DJD1_9BACT|nr:cell surface protein SprA [Fulvitalea axinellae]
MPLAVSAQVNNGTGEKKDTPATEPYKKTSRPEYEPEDRNGDPFSNRLMRSPYRLSDPAFLNLGYELDTANNFRIYERFGDGVNYRPDTYMSFEEYDRLHTMKVLRDYWRARSAGLDGKSAVSDRKLIPPIYLSPIFDRIFGGSVVNIKPSGSVNLDLGGRWVRTFNPSVPVAQQRSGGLDFDMQMSLNLVGQIGEKLKVTANVDNNNAFNFQNDLKVEYTGYDEEIIKKIEVGNVSMGLDNSLIRGAQNLFGVKTQLQFGRLYMTSVMTTQRGQSETIRIGSNGTPGQGKQFTKRVSDYDENRHFFLSHFFRDKYEEWVERPSRVISGVNVTRVEVYVINRSNNTTTLRNVAGLMDLGEPERVYRTTWNPKRNGPASNDANSLFSTLRNNETDFRDPTRFESAAKGHGMENTVDYVLANGARKLTKDEFYFNSALGYISLKRSLQSDEMLAVSYEYTYNGRAYRVGELSENYSKVKENQLIYMKLLRPNKINTEVPTWDLMMKNVYGLGVSRIEKEGFELQIKYRDNTTGLDNPSLSEGASIKGKPLVNVLGLDQLNQNGDPISTGDGYFDFVEGVTVIPDYGLVVFPILEPFGDNLENKFVAGTEDFLINKYVYHDLYGKTKNEAQQDVNKDKFTLVGRVASGSASEIALPGIGIAENSVVVTAGGMPLTENIDYRVDYNLGRVIILNQSIMTSGKEIAVSYEKSDLFNFSSRTLLGTRLDYKINENFNIGATMLYLRERPIVSRVSIGSEPLNNVKYGFDINYSTESRFLTRMMDALPVVSTKEPSSFRINAEFAQLMSGTSNKVDGESTSYIDDFETAVIPYSLTSGYLEKWKLATTPDINGSPFDLGKEQDPHLLNGKRAKLAWYIVDNLFYRSSSTQKPSNIGDDDLENHYVRPVPPQELFPNRDDQVINVNLPVFDMAYYPDERGPYNFNTNLDAEGKLRKPEENWGGIMRAITNETDFDQTNIEYIEFWMLDPFIAGKNGQVQGINNTTGGELVFNLGNVSEDIFDNGRHIFENGLPGDGSDNGVTPMDPWGRVTTQQILNKAFDNDSGSRQYQDVGFDGLGNAAEQAYAPFQTFLNSIPASAREKIGDDVAGDDFRYYLGGYHDDRDHKILERYKSFNGIENNSPVVSGGSYTPSNSPKPDNSDLNDDNTISTLEAYYEYKVKLKPGSLSVGEGYITDHLVAEAQNGETVNWYLFRIPIRTPDRVQGNIQGFKNMRYLRMYMTGFKQPAVLRMVNFRFAGAQWRKYDGDLYHKGFQEIPKPVDTRNFTVSAVNVEENTGYVLPPGINRDRDNTSTVERRVNEQSMQLCVDELKDRDARAAFKNTNLDLVNYGKVKMFIHAETEDALDGDLKAFVRLGADFTQNYYEIELPLVFSAQGAQDPYEVWPEENAIDLAFDELYTLKKERDRKQASLELPYSKESGKYRLTVVGRPALSGVETLMIGVRNPKTPDGESKSACIWVNELRVTDFDSKDGWAANVRMNTKLADVAEINASTRYVSSGFGEIQQKINERTREDRIGYDISARVNVDKFGPDRLGLKIPMFVSYEKEVVTPFYDPLDPDIPLSASLNAFENESARSDYKKMVQDRTTRRAISFTNVRKEKRKPDAKKHFYDLENLNFTYAYSDVTSSNYNTESYVNEYYRGVAAYQYTPEEILWEPFKGATALESPYLKWLKDFNISPIPSSVSVTAEVDRRFVRTQLRNEKMTIEGIDPTFDKYFYFNRSYALRWNLTNSLSMNYNARVNAIVDEPLGDLNTQAKKDSVRRNFMNFGRIKNYNQQLSFNYRLPLDKLPLTDWMSADASYDVGYNWEAGPLPDPEEPDLYFGNTIENNRQYGLTGKVDFVKLYNKNKFLKSLNGRKRSSRSSSRQKGAHIRKKNEEDTVRDFKALKGLARLMMSLRSVNFNYTVTEGTLLPGFANNPHLLGFDEDFDSPGLPFILGSQDPSIRYTASENGWLVQTPSMTTPFNQAKSLNLKISAKLEPFRDFSVKVNFDKRKTDGYQELFRFDDAEDVFRSLTPARSGSYSVSFLPVSTAFSGNGIDSDVFDEFVKNRAIVKGRLDADAEGSGVYGENSQDVLIPAFIAAYSGKNASSVGLSPFPSIPMPNWRIDYTGLKRIPALKKLFTSITLSHAYTSTYSVDSYTNALDYNDPGILSLDQNIEDYQSPTIVDDNGELVPVYIINQVLITERFRPLIGFNLRTKNRIMFKFQYNTERTAGLTISNAQITEMNSKDFVFDVSYTKAGLKLPFKFDGRTIVLDNDLTMRLTARFKDTQTVQRRIDEENKITNGNMNIQVRPTLDYQVNRRLNVQMYYERSVNEPKISTSYRRTTTAFGVQVRFSLS